VSRIVWLCILLLNFALGKVFAVASNNSQEINLQLKNLEQLSNGRLGVYALNTGNNKSINYRGNERFPFCSTGKVMTVAAILDKSQQESGILKFNIKYRQSDIDKSGYAPITSKYLQSGMTIADLSKTTLQYSDNTAMNLLVSYLGGPQVVTRYARSIGDKKFQLNRSEPELNSATPGDVRDTTTPHAMVDSLSTLVLSNLLGNQQQLTFQKWLQGNTTGDNRIRKGVPDGWVVGDKTGTGKYGTTNDAGIIWPARNCAPIVITVYYTGNEAGAKPNEQIIASATRLVVKHFARSDKCLQKGLVAKP